MQKNDIMRRYREFIVYTIFGFMATVLNASLYAALYNIAGLGNMASTSIALAATISFAFLTNKIWVYRSASWNIMTVLKELSAFFAARLLSSVFDIAFMYVSVDILSLMPVAMKLTAALGVGLINYFMGKIVFYRRNEE